MIKRTRGPHAHNNNAPGDGTTLAERLAASRSAPELDADVEAEDEAVEEVVAELRDEAADAPEPDTEVKPDFANTDAIVAAAKAARDRKGPGRASAGTCLVVDDSRVIRKIASTIMRDLGFTVSEAEDGAEALARCKQAMPQVILTDWNMPVMTGLEFVTALRKLPEAASAKVMFCTSKGAAQDIHSGIKAGADDYIVKPFSEDALKAKLDALGVA